MTEQFERSHPHEFNVGEIYAFSKGPRSAHKTFPYYVIIKEVNKNFSDPTKSSIVTEIPGNGHSLIIDYSNWDYHFPRMHYKGNGPEEKLLIFNQPNILNSTL